MTNASPRHPGRRAPSHNGSYDNDSHDDHSHDDERADERFETIVRRFSAFVAAYPELPLYRAICQGVAHDPEVAGLLLAASPGQERPVLLLAALHDLVLRLGPDATPASRWYASVVGRDDLPEPRFWTDPGPWPDVRRTMLDHRDEITGTIASRSTQTNEVNRGVYVLAMLALAGDDLAKDDLADDGRVHDSARLPVALVEPGCSAGLLLTSDRYDVRVEGGAEVRWGDPGSAVRLAGEDRTPSGDGPLAARGITPPPIVGRIGLDLAPVPADETGELRWLKACLWPDVPGRVERFEAAVAQRRRDSDEVTLLAGDITDPKALSKALQAAVEQAERAGHAAVTFASPTPGAIPVVSPALHIVVLTSWTTTYVERSQRERIAAVLGGFAASTGLPVTWCGAEPAGSMPGLGELPESVHASSTEGVTVLAARRWRAGREELPIVWGTADPHGRWLRLEDPPPQRR